MDTLIREDDILMSTANSLNLLGRTTYVREVPVPMAFGAFMTLLRPRPTVLGGYLIHCLRTPQAFDFYRQHANTTTNISNLNSSSLANFQIPLPPRDVQREIVAEIEGYQRVMDGARAVVEAYRPHVEVDPSWPLVRLGEVCGKPQYGSNTSKAPYDGEVRYVRITDLTDDGRLKETDAVSPSIVEPACFLEPDDLLIARSGSVGRSYLHGHLPGTYQYAGYLIRFRVDTSRALPAYLFHYMHTGPWYEWVARNTKVGAQPNINAQQYASCGIPLPPLDVQQAIVAELEAERSLVEANRELITRMESRIASAGARVWGGRGVGGAG